jgi:hypothetical protein
LTGKAGPTDPRAAEERRLMRLLKHPIHRARINRTRLFHNNRHAFLQLLVSELGALQRRADRRQRLAVARPNGTSDIAWECIAAPGTWDSVIDIFPRTQFYDYTKDKRRARVFGEGGFPKNYHLTFSRSEQTLFCEVADLIGAGVNVAAVFAAPLPARWYGIPVIDGDASDFRFADPPGVIVGLTAKGRAKHDASGFVIPIGDAGREGGADV